MLPPELSATMRKQFIKDLKKLGKILKKVKSMKIVDFEKYKEIKEKIIFINSRLNFKV